MSGRSFHDQRELTERPGGLAPRVVEQLQQLRRVVPARRLPDFVRKRVDRLWEVPEFRASQEHQMRALLSHTERAPEVPELAYLYAQRMLLRAYLRFHPRAVTRQPVQGVEWLTHQRDPARTHLLSFMHHGQYEGMASSLGHHGVEIQMLLSPLISGPNVAIAYRQQHRIFLHHRLTHEIRAEGGTDRIIEQLRPGGVLGIAPDVPGRTPVTFLGRERMASFGTARIATITNSPVVLVTAHRDGDGTSLRLHEPLDPADYEGPEALHAEIMRRHEAPVLAFPEALDTPTARFGEPGGQ